MKVELKLSPDTIFATARLLEQVYEMSNAIGQSEKLIRSISYDVADAFLSKQKAVRKKQSLFEDKKKYKI